MADKQRRIPWRAFLFIALITVNAAIDVLFFSRRAYLPDVAEYEGCVKYLASNAPAICPPYRILKPLPILIASFLSHLGIPAQDALLLQSIAFYFASTWLMFLFVRALYGDEYQAALAGLLYAGAYPMVAYGLTPLTDVSGWFFVVLCASLAWRSYIAPSLYLAFAGGFAAGLGTLFKESSTSGLVAILCAIAFNNLPKTKKAKFICIAALPFCLIFAANSILIYSLFRYSYFDWYLDAIKSASGYYYYSLARTLVEILRVLSIGWIFFAVAVAEELLERSKRVRFYIAIFLSSLTILFWPFLHNRIMFVAAALLIPLASRGLVAFGRKNALLYLALYFVLNYLFFEISLEYGRTIRAIFR